MRAAMVVVVVAAACGHGGRPAPSKPRPAVTASQPSSIPAPLLCGLRGKLDPTHRVVCRLRDADTTEAGKEAIEEVMRIGPAAIPVLRQVLRDRRTRTKIAPAHQQILVQTLRDLETVKANILQVAPTPMFAVNASFEDKVVYLGFDIDTGNNNNVIIPHAPVTFIHYWKVLEPLRGWRLLVHLAGSDGKGFINADHRPVSGRHPVTRWRPGEIVRDEHVVRLPRCWRAPRVTLYVGVWKPGRGIKRLKPSTANDGEDRVEAGAFSVKVLSGCS